MISSTRFLSRAVFERVNAVSQDSEIRDGYARIARQMPMLIRKNGLIQALRFLRHKAGTPDGTDIKRYMDDFCGVQTSQGENWPTLASYISFSAGIDTLEALYWTTDYMRATQFALRQAEWFKRFAESVLAEDRLLLTIEAAAP